MSHSARLHGLYAITSPTQNLVAAVSDAIRGGAQVIQYRDKHSTPTERLNQANQLVQLCQSHQVPLIINDDLELAAKVDADGVHLGKDDTDIKSTRKRLGTDAIIGVSCYNQLDLAISAQEQGADYVAFGSFFPSTTKPNAIRANLDLLLKAREAIKIPIVAIGGITPENGPALIASGADMLAVISGLFQQPDIIQATMNYANLFQTRSNY